MDADVRGLIEIENDEGERQAAAALVDAIDTHLGAEVYDYLDTGVVGTDAIKMAYIYKPETVELAGDDAILDSSVEPRFDDTRSRPVIAQTLTEIASGESVTVAVNHLKSKGSACDPVDNDPRQGNCNGVRLRAAQAMADWLAEDPTGQQAVGTLIIGDLDAYAKEDPIVALLDAGYTGLLAKPSDGEMPYSYTFDATQGYLDHALGRRGRAPLRDRHRGVEHQRRRGPGHRLPRVLLRRPGQPALPHRADRCGVLPAGRVPLLRPRPGHHRARPAPVPADRQGAVQGSRLAARVPRRELPQPGAVRRVRGFGRPGRGASASPAG
jgi:hypothetical protein